MHDLLRTLSAEQKSHWPEYLPQLVFSYNTTIHQSTGESPHFIMFGQEPQLPIDFLLGRVPEPEGGRVSEWVQEHQRRLTVVFHGAKERLQAAAARRKERHDQGAQNVPLEVGQFVYLRDHGVRGRTKIQDAWSPILHQVVRAPPPGGVVYSVAPVHDLNGSRQVHRVMLKLARQNHRPEPPDVPLEPMIAADHETEDHTGQWVVVRAPGVQTQPAHLDPVAPPPELSDPSSPLVQVDPSAPAPLTPTAASPDHGALAPRRTSRTTAGRHGNLHRLPVSVVSRTDGATNPQVPGSSSNMTAVFRPWC
ncbi:uncharacterized protein LOC125291202 [Alosa alosa]|uniref:uncharacterized protein LOC125291202 n=1 Tax=Alosa alosa TaxID=278164 RepID=UPI00201506AF|nr:uncharacterized protein LOC125291202 [Alosa alosa]